MTLNRFKKYLKDTGYNTSYNFTLIILIAKINSSPLKHSRVFQEV